MQNAILQRINIIELMYQRILKRINVSNMHVGE